MREVTLQVEGMNCAHCVQAVREALSGVEGVRVESVTIGSARVAFDPQKVQIGSLVDAVSDAGYTADEAVA